MSAERPKLLTLKLDFQTYAEFAAAVVILRGRTLSSFVYQFVVSKIREAQTHVSPEEFNNVVEIQKIEILKRSEIKKREQSNPASNASNGTTETETVNVIGTLGGERRSSERRTQEQNVLVAENRKLEDRRRQA